MEVAVNQGLCYKGFDGRSLINEYQASEQGRYLALAQMLDQGGNGGNTWHNIIQPFSII
jgi:hypothetical protein